MQLGVANVSHLDKLASACCSSRMGIWMGVAGRPPTGRVRDERFFSPSDGALNSMPWTPGVM